MELKTKEIRCLKLTESEEQLLSAAAELINNIEMKVDLYDKVMIEQYVLDNLSYISKNIAWIESRTFVGEVGED